MNKEEFHAQMKVGDKLMYDISMIGSGKMVEVEVVETLEFPYFVVKRSDGQTFRNEKTTRMLDMSDIDV